MYEQTISALNDTKTVSAHITNLSKISIETEDPQLKLLLTGAIAELQQIYLNPQFQPKSTPVNLINSKERNLKQLKAYCSQFIAVKKPEWQVLAEQNGWTPPKE